MPCDTSLNTCIATSHTAVAMPFSNVMASKSGAVSRPLARNLHPVNYRKYVSKFNAFATPPWLPA